MNRTRKILALAVAALACWSAPAFAQDGGAAEEQVIPKNRFQKDEHLISQLLKKPDEAPESIREEVMALRQSQVEIRKAWIEEYRPGDHATAEEIRTARQAFQKDYAAEIRASRELRGNLVRRLRSGVRDAVNDATWSEQARAVYAEYQENQTELKQAWEATLEELGEGATREEVKAAQAEFDQEYASTIARQKALARQLRVLLRDNREEKVSLRDDLPPELQDLRSDMANLRDQVRFRQRKAREDMMNLSREEREEYRRALLEELKQLHDEVKLRRRQAIEEIREDQAESRGPKG